MCIWGCTNDEKCYDEYKDMIVNGKGYDEVRERTKSGKYIYALTDSRDIYSYNDIIIRYDISITI